MQQMQMAKTLAHVKAEGLGILRVILGSLFIALCAQIFIPLPFSPVPLTCQTLAILFLGATLGSRQAAACTILYLFEGIVGLPFLAGGFAKPQAFFGATAGYLYAMPLLAYIAGWASPKKSFGQNLAILALGTLVLLFLGTLGLTILVGWAPAFYMGFYPFLPGDALKILMVASYLTYRKRFV